MVSKMNATWLELLDFQPRKNRRKEMDTKFSMFPSSSPSKAQLVQSNTFFPEPSLAASNNDPESFHCAIGPFLVLGQILGIFPVAGVLKPTPLKLKFEKFSFLTVYAAAANAAVFAMLSFYISWIVSTITFTTTNMKVGLIAIFVSSIYGSCMMFLIGFFWLSPRWVILQRDWRSMEQFLDSNIEERPKLRWKFHVISSVTFLYGSILLIVELLASLEKDKWKSGSKNATFENFLQIFCKNSHMINLQTVEHNIILGMFIFILHHFAVFTCLYADAFIMLVSTGLAERYKVLNKEWMTSTSKPQTVIDWCRYRESYAALSCMVKKVDDNISPLIFVSFAKNLYVICVYLLMGLTHADDSSLFNIIYSFGALIFLFGRTLSTALLASRINDQSKVILPTLYNCSASTYNIDTKRLIHQLTTDNIALTGMHFFSITRSFLKGLVSAIVSYEIVMWQFNV